MKGKLSKDKWVVWKGIGNQDFHASRVINNKVEYVEVHSHCLVCAKIKILTEYGGQVDLRGCNNQGMCGNLLKSAQLATIQGE